MNKKYITIALLAGLIISASVVSADQGRPPFGGGGMMPPRPQDGQEMQGRPDSSNDDGGMDQEQEDMGMPQGPIRGEMRDTEHQGRFGGTPIMTSPRGAHDNEDNVQEEIDRTREDFQKNIDDNKPVTREMIQEKRANIIQFVQNKRELFDEEFSARKDAMEAAREKFKPMFETGLAKIKDEAKKTKVLGIANNLPEINKAITERAVIVVNQIESVLITIESRADKAEAAGNDVATLRGLISNAEDAIAAARTAIATQVGIAYTVNIKSDATVKTSLSTVRDQLKTDVKKMNETIKTAHDATKKAAEALKAIPGVDDDNATEENDTQSAPVEESSTQTITN